MDWTTADPSRSQAQQHAAGNDAYFRAAQAMATSQQQQQQHYQQQQQEHLVNNAAYPTAVASQGAFVGGGGTTVMNNQSHAVGGHHASSHHHPQNHHQQQQAYAAHHPNQSHRQAQAPQASYYHHSAPAQALPPHHPPQQQRHHHQQAAFRGHVVGQSQPQAPTQQHTQQAASSSAAVGAGGSPQEAMGPTPGSRPGTHQFKVSGTVFEVEERYNLIRPIGTGAYGVVISAADNLTNQKVAIKKVSRAFDDVVDAKRILREIKLLRHFHHENIISVLDILAPPNLERFEDVYIVSDLMETDLHRIIYSRQPLSIDHVQYFIYQVLRAVKYMHSANVLHRDLKPSNLLLNSNCDLKVCDLGLARGLSTDNQASQDLTEYVVTRWYRAPEIMLACQEYTKAIDIWSVGCIFAELLARQPIFPGNDYIDQLRLICSKLGRPSEENLGFVTSQRAKRFLLSLPPTPPTPLSHLFPDRDEKALDLLSKMLQFNPADRLTAHEALQHPFMDMLHNEDDEPTTNAPFSFDFENEELDKRRLQYLIFLEMLHYHPEEMSKLPENPPQPVPHQSHSHGHHPPAAPSHSHQSSNHQQQPAAATGMPSSSFSAVPPAMPSSFQGAASGMMEVTGMTTHT